jgi:N-acetylglucosamine kinase-like BadF-type ATPase
MTRYFLGADIGSSKTHVLIADEQGQAAGFGEAGAGNHEVVGYDGLYTALSKAAHAALAAANLSIEQISAAGFGVSGYDWPCERQDTLDAISKVGFNCPIDAVNDAMIGLIAGAEAGWGLAVVSGSGCNCWGRDQNNRLANMTGSGWRFAEGAGASELVEEAFRRVSLAWSHRGPATQLTEEFMQYTGATSADDLLEGLAMERYEIHADAAPLIFAAAHEGDLVARTTIEWAGKELGSLALSIIHQLGFEKMAFDIVLVGSLFKGGALLVNPMRQVILDTAPLARLVQLAVPPAIGAVLLGMEQIGAPTSASRQALARSKVELWPRDTNA